jgi:two-component system cell cycle response regulator
LTEPLRIKYTIENGNLMDTVHILLADDDQKNLEFMCDVLSRGPYRLFTTSSIREASTLLVDKGIHIAVVGLPDDIASCGFVCRDLRYRYSDRPLQIVLISSRHENLTIALEGGGDDFLVKPLDSLEFETRIKAAVLRYKTQSGLYQEKEFFRQAVKQEEDLSSKILDQHIQLKEAFKNIEVMNQELEKTNRKLEKIAKFDSLSGLLNRQTLFGLIDIEIERSMRTGTPLSGIMLDIDNFKNINDNFGHTHGDVVIRKLGELMLNTLRKYDHAGRYGGEEFFIVLPNTFRNQAALIAERFRNELDALMIDFEGVSLHVTASLGIAQFRPGESKETWIDRADKAMYRAKQGGRNQVALEL